MTTASNYPDSFDNAGNLFVVFDDMRVRLAEDYNPGDTAITVLGDETVMRRFNNTGVITLTEQCSDPESRALSLSYTARTLTTFEGLAVLPGFTDVPKPKILTNVTQNVMAAHHNNVKDAVVAIQHFAGKKGEIAARPLEGTMEERVNYLRKIVLQPKAWFSVDKTVGLAPFTVTFTDKSFRLGTDGTSISVTSVWDFGDNTSNISLISDINVSSIVPSTISNVSVIEVGPGNTITKTYNQPGLYTVKLTVTNDFGTDSVAFEDLISARYPAPEEAVVTFLAKSNQIITRAGVPATGPYTVTPIIRAPINSVIDMGIPSGENPGNPGYTYAGEKLGPGGSPIDMIQTYTWSLSDDVPHSNSPATRAVFSVGGNYDLVLRCDTEFGSYRITSYEGAFDIVERYSLWLWLYSSDTPSTTRTASVSEFGLLSETFKALVSPVALNVDQSFLVDSISNPVPNQTQQQREFHRNTGFSPATSTASGNGGSCLLWWASGRAPAGSKLGEQVFSSQFTGFTQVYSAGFTGLMRPWNWVSMASTKKAYFILGQDRTNTVPASFTSPTYQAKDAVSLADYSVASPAVVLGPTNYKNGANELTNNEVAYDNDPTHVTPDPETRTVYGESLQGNMSVYRSCWNGDAGYFLRNEGAGVFFRIKSFYKTSGNTGEPFLDIRKLPDMPGAARTEGQLVSLSTGVFFFNNSGGISAYNPITGVWGTGGPGVNSASFRSLQDTTKSEFDSTDQTLLAASDGDKLAYLSFDYSNRAFIRFNEVDTTFSSVTSRPSGSQWNMGIF